METFPVLICKNSKFECTQTEIMIAKSFPVTFDVIYLKMNFNENSQNQSFQILLDETKGGN